MYECVCMSVCMCVREENREREREITNAFGSPHRCRRCVALCCLRTMILDERKRSSRARIVQFRAQNFSGKKTLYRLVFVRKNRKEQIVDGSEEWTGRVLLFRKLCLVVRPCSDTVKIILE